MVLMQQAAFTLDVSKINNKYHTITISEKNYELMGNNFTKFFGGK